MHEFVLTGAPAKRELGVKTLDIAKRLLDYGFHPPTIYFPLLVDEALMFEPTETETRESLDELAEAIESILLEAEEDPEILHQGAVHDAGAPPRRGRRQPQAGPAPAARRLAPGDGAAKRGAAAQVAQRAGPRATSLGRGAACRLDPQQREQVRGRHERVGDRP